MFCHFAAREAQVFCYLTSWSAKRPGAGRFESADLQPSLCTHVIYAFATLSDHKLDAASGTEDQYSKIIALREKNPNLKVNKIQLSENIRKSLRFAGTLTVEDMRIKRKNVAH